MKKFNLLRKSERKSVGTTLALTVGSPSVDRRYSALKHLTFMLLFLLGSLNVWGADVIDNAATSAECSSTATNSWVSDFSISGTSGAEYRIHTMGTKNTSNALQWNKNGFLTQTKTGGTLKSITIKGTSGKSIDVYAANSAYSTSAPSGTAVATLSLTGNDATYTFTSDYTYFALKGKESSTQIVSITIEYKSGGGSTPSLSLDPSSLDLAATGNAQQSITLTASNFSGSVNNVECAFFSAATCQPSEAIAQPEWITSLSDNNSNQVSFNVKDNDGAARNIWMKVTASDGSGSASAILPISQAKFVAPATLPFEYDGNGTGELPNGLEVSGTGTYGSSPAIKFDGTGDYVIIHFSDAPDKLTYDIKGNSFSGGTFTVQESADGADYTEVASYTSLGDVQNKENDLNSASRYVKFIYTNKSNGNVALGNIAISAYDPSEPCATPAISPASGTYDATQNVTITCATEGATIYYTTDGSNPTTSSSVYSSAINVSSDMTIKAIAAKTGYANSSVATETYEINLPYANIAAFIAGGPTTAKSLTLNNAIIIGVDGTTLYIQDETAGIMIYGLASLPEHAAPNHSISGTIVGKYSLYKNQHELVKPNNATPIDITNVTVSADPVSRPDISSYATLEAAYAAKPMMLVKLTDVRYDGTQYEFSGNKIYNTFGALTDKTMPETTVDCDITGVVINYNGTLELLPVFASDIVADADAAAPTVSPEGGADAENAVTAAAVEITAAANTKVDGLASKTVDINSAIPTEVTVEVTRDFYRSVNFSCGYYKAAAAKYNINGQGATTEGEVLAKVAGVAAATAAAGDDVHVFITPNAHFHLATILVNGVAPATVTAGEEYSFTMPGEAVTIAVTWTEDEKYALTFTAGEGSGDAPAISGNEYYAGEVIQLPANTFTYDAQHKFTKWLIGETEYAAGVNYTMPAAPTEAVAQWKTIPALASGDWILVKDADELTAGSYVIIASADVDEAMKPYVSGSNCKTAEATIENGLLTYNNVFAVYEIREGNKENTFALQDISSDYYLYAASSSSNDMRTEETLTDNSSWTASITSTGDATLVAQGSNTRNVMHYNPNGTNPSVFSCYASTSTVTGLVTLYKYHAPSLKLTYDKNTTDDVTNLPGVQVVDGENKVTVSSEVPLRENYIFNGWKDGESNDHAAGDVITLSANMTLYAQWRTPNTYSISYNANGGTLIDGKSEITPNPTSVTEGNAYIVEDNVYKLAGKLFLGWQAGGVLYNEGQEIHPTENMAFVAQWGDPTVTDFILVTDVNQLQDGDKVYIVTAGNSKVALGTQNSGNYRNPVEVEKQNNRVVILNAAPVELTIGKTSTGYTLKDGENYLYSTSAKSINVRSDAFEWAITIDENGTSISAGGSAGKLQYNSSSPRFATYTSTQKAVSIYKKANYTRTVTEGRYGTICLPQAGQIIGATLYEVAHKDASKIYFDEILNGQMEAGNPYIFLPNSGESQLAVLYTSDVVETAKSVNGLVGFIGANADDEMNVPVGAYILSNNQYREVVTLGSAKIKSYRSYININLEGIPNSSMPAPGRRRISMSYNGSQVATGVENAEANEAPRKVLINGEMFIIRGEKMYDAKGQLVK